VPGRATLCQVVPRCATRRRLGEHLGNAVVPRCARLCQVVPEGIAHSVAHSRQEVRQQSEPSPTGAHLRPVRNSEPPGGDKVVVDEGLGELLCSYRGAA
jgi:hypothetical protein